MCKFTRLRSLVSLVPIVAVILATGCGSQAPHPNQLNAFDGASYNTLTLAHGALTSLRPQISVSYPKYAPVFNQAAASYTAAFNAYSLFRLDPSDQTGVALAIGNLTVSVVALENSLQADMHVSPAVIADIHRKSRTLLENAERQHLTVSDLLTELEIAAAVARAVPATEAYAGIASMVILATSQALEAESAASGQPIDLATIQPIATL